MEIDYDRLSITTTFKQNKIKQMIAVKNEEGKWETKKVIFIDGDGEVYVKNTTD